MTREKPFVVKGSPPQEKRGGPWSPKQLSDSPWRTWQLTMYLHFPRPPRPRSSRSRGRSQNSNHGIARHTRRGGAVPGNRTARCGLRGVLEPGLCNADQYRTHAFPPCLPHGSPMPPPRLVLDSPTPRPRLTHTDLQRRPVSHRYLRRRHQRLFMPRLFEFVVYGSQLRHRFGTKFRAFHSSTPPNNRWTRAVCLCSGSCSC